MRRVFCIATFAAFFVFAAVSLLADEGMWPVDRLDLLPWASLKAMGLRLQPKDIYDGKGHGLAYAVVSLGGGTGSFVSRNGLILTNHHVAFGAIQRASSSEHNYIEQGFFAENQKDEIEAIGVRAYVLAGISDVTSKVLSAVSDDMSDLERYRAIERRIKELVAEAEQGGSVECRIVPFFEGLQYKLFTFFVCKDVRIVYAPPASIGNYGGDIDNWMWPRHGGDFAFLRAYVSPGGASAEYSPDNVPYRPAVYLPLSKRGIVEGDFAMIIGYPGRTGRYTISQGVEHLESYFFPTRIRIFSDWIDILQEESKRGPDVAIKNAIWDQRLNNSMKNYEGMLEGFKKGKLLEKRRETEKSFKRWLSMDPEMAKKYQDVLPALEALYERQKSYREKNMVSGLMVYGCQMLGAASLIDRWSEEREKPDLEREQGYQDRDISRLKQRLAMLQTSYDRRTDQRVLEYFLNLAVKLPADQRIKAVDDALGNPTADNTSMAIAAFIDRLYGGTKLEDPAERMRLFDLSRKELLAAGDPFVDFAVALDAERRAIEDEEHTLTGAFQRLYSRYLQAVMAWKGTAIYPDANGTMRLTYGQVKGYSPRDAVQYKYITSLNGVVEKHTGEEPFDCPARLLELVEKMDYGDYEDRSIGDVPVDFLTTCDITGGNSGSPVINGSGECIGAAFDGNYESISSDYLFDKERTRSINVDSRYILFVVDRFSAAKRLLEEMTIR